MCCRYSHSGPNSAMASAVARLPGYHPFCKGLEAGSLLKIRLGTSGSVRICCLTTAMCLAMARCAHMHTISTLPACF